MRGVVHHRPYLLQVRRIGIADVEVGDGAVGYHIRRHTALGDDPLDARFRPERRAKLVDVGEQQPDGGEGITPVPRRHLVRRRATVNEPHAVDVQAAGSEPCSGALGGAAGMAAHDDVRILEDASIVHHRLAHRRHHLFRRRAVDDHATGCLARGEPLTKRHRGGYADGALRAVLVAMEVALSAAQRVVLQDDAEVGRAVVAVVTGDEGRLQSGHTFFDREAVFLQVVDQKTRRPLFLEAGLGMARDVVGQGEQFAVHQLFRPGDYRVPFRVRAGEPGDEAGHVERLLHVGDLPDDAPRHGPFSGSVLRL